MQERSNSNTFRELYETAQLDMEAPRAASIFEEPGPAHSRSVRLPRGWRCPGGMNGRLVQPPRLRGSALRAPRMCGYVFNNHVAMSTLSFTFSLRVRVRHPSRCYRGVSDFICRSFLSARCRACLSPASRFSVGHTLELRTTHTPQRSRQACYSHV